MQQRKKSSLSEFFSAKIFVVTQEKFPPGCRTEKIALPPLNCDQKVEFWPFLACCVQPRWCSWLHWSLLTPFNRDWDRDDRESVAIRKDGVGGGGGRFKMISRQSKIAYSSVVSVGAEFSYLKANVVLPIVYA